MKYWQQAIKIPSMSAFFGWMLVHFLFAAPACLGQSFTFKDGYKKETLDFDIIKNLMIVPLYINQKGPFNFILDTGVGTFIITDHALIDTLQLKNLTPTKVYGLGKGHEIEAYRTNRIDISIKNAEMIGVPTAILQKDVFNLSSYLGVKIYGLIGYNFFSSFDVKINYVAKKLTFGIPGRIKKRGEKFDISIENLRPYIYADLKPKDRLVSKVKLIIDCGASHALSMDNLDGKAFPLPKDTISANLGVGLGGEISGSMGRIERLSLGKFSFSNVLSGFPNYQDSLLKANQTFKNGNLGAELLKRFNLIFDYANAAVYLKPNQLYKTPFEHDMAGIEVYGDPAHKGRLFIGRIERDSPAEKAGLKVDDEILGINFKPVRDISLEEIGLTLKSQDGKTVVIEIFREQKNIIKLIRLKRRI